MCVEVEVKYVKDFENEFCLLERWYVEVEVMIESL